MQPSFSTTSHQAKTNDSFKLEMIQDSSWAYSQTSIWKLLFLKVTHKWPLTVFIKPEAKKSLYEDGWLYQSGYIRVIQFISVPHLPLAFTFPQWASIWGSTQEHGLRIRASAPSFMDEKTETQRCQTTSPGSHSWTAAEPGLKRSSSDFQPLCFFLNHIHFINIYVVKLSFVKSVVTWTK